MKKTIASKIAVIGMLSGTLLIFIPGFFNRDFTEAFSLGAQIVSALSGVGLFVTAVLFYRSRIASKISDQSTDSVLMLVQEIRSLVLQVMVMNNKTLSLWTLVTVSGKGDDKVSDDSLTSALDDYKMAVDPNNYYDELEKIIKLSNDMYLPADIRLVAEKLLLGPLIEIEWAEGKTVTALIFNKAPNLAELDTEIMEPVEPITLRGYYKRMQDCIYACEEWLRNESVTPIQVEF